MLTESHYQLLQWLFGTGLLSLALLAIKTLADREGILIWDFVIIFFMKHVTPRDVVMVCVLVAIGGLLLYFLPGLS